MHKIISSILIVIAFTSCQNSKDKKANIIVTNKAKDKIEISQYQTQSGKNFIVNADYSIGANICDLKIETKYFTEVNTVHKFGLTDPVKDVFISDLDKNGFEEIFVVTTSAGSGSYSNIYGLASNKDKSATPIYIPKPLQQQLSQGGIFEGYRGHNKISLKSGKLLNTFPIYKKDDLNYKPTGNTKKVKYCLIAGEAGWILEPFKVIL